MDTWSKKEIEIIVQDYFEMLDKELLGIPYSKADHWRKLSSAIKRSKGSIEFKYGNISAVLQKLDLKHIQGYKPFRNYQKDLELAVKDFLSTNTPPSLTRSGNQFPFQSFSWEVLSEDVLIKTADKSVFLHHGTGVPQDIRKYFGIDNLLKGEKQPVLLIFGNQHFKAEFQLDKQESPRARLFWKNDFVKLLKRQFPNWQEFELEDQAPSDSAPKIRFEVLGQAKIKVDFIDPTIITSDVDDLSENQPTSKDGAARIFYGTKYERDHKNRVKAIQYHGTTCVICGFSYQNIYGERGLGYIEVHHIKPLHTLKEEMIVDPKTDLFPVCANCHRMIHRRKTHILSIDEMKKIVSQKG